MASRKAFNDDERSLLTVDNEVEAFRGREWRMMRVTDSIVTDENGYERCPVLNVDPQSYFYGRSGYVFPGDIRECVR